jgi:hypothetical protein
VTAAVARAPNTDARRVCAGECFAERNGVAIVAGLQPGIDFLSRCPVARAEAAIVKNKRGIARFEKCLRIDIEIHLFDGRKAVRHHDQR